MAFANQPRRICSVLDDPVTVDHIEACVGVRQGLAVGDAQLLGGDAIQLEIPARKIDRRLRKVHTCYARAALAKSHEIGADAAPHLEQPLPLE